MQETTTTCTHHPWSPTLLSQAIDAQLPALLSFAGGASASETTKRARALAQHAGAEPRVSLELLAVT